MIVPVSSAEMSRFVRDFLEQTHRSVILAGAVIVKLTPQLNVLHGLRIIIRALMKDVCPLMGGWGF